MKELQSTDERLEGTNAGEISEMLNRTANRVAEEEGLEGVSSRQTEGGRTIYSIESEGESADIVLEEGDVKAVVGYDELDQELYGEAIEQATNYAVVQSIEGNPEVENEYGEELEEITAGEYGSGQEKAEV